MRRYPNWLTVNQVNCSTFIPSFRIPALPFKHNLVESDSQSPQPISQSGSIEPQYLTGLRLIAVRMPEHSGQKQSLDHLEDFLLEFFFTLSEKGGDQCVGI